MDKEYSDVSYTVSSLEDSKTASRKARGDCNVSASTSHTQFFKKSKYDAGYERITTNEYLNISESLSSTETFHCEHKPSGKQYTKKGLLKRNFVKNLDPIPTEAKWTNECAPALGWEMAKKLEFLVQDPTVVQQKDRLAMHLRDLAEISCKGYRVDVLDSVCLIMDFLVEKLPKDQSLYELIVPLLKNMNHSIIMMVASDVVKYFDSIKNFMGFLGYLLMRMESDELFDLVSDALLWHLSAPDSLRAPDRVRLRHTLAAAAPTLYQTVTRMIPVSTPHRFPTFLKIALILACDSQENCIELMNENIIENIFYRFNPYFPERPLPVYDINPANPQDVNVKLGDSAVNLSVTLSLLLVLLKTTQQYLYEDPKQKLLLPCPDSYSLRCFVWAYRYECRARDHQHQRLTLTVIAHILLRCFGNRLNAFSTALMPDIMTLSVFTEIPPRDDWTNKVNFSTSQRDVQFKKNLIYLAIDLLKVFPENIFMVEHRYWLLGLCYLIDPGLSCLRARWAPTLYSEIRKVTLQALVFTLPLMPQQMVKQYGLIRRAMWFIEWYSVCPYELPILYWCLRLLHTTIYNRDSVTRSTSLKNLFDTHGIIILIHLCYTLIGQKQPPVERSQVILAICLRLLTSAVEANSTVSCAVYPDIKWPNDIIKLARKMLDVVLYSLEKHYIINDRWLIALLNFIWEAIIWNSEYREKFILDDGIYKLLDLITMTNAPVQCLALALICDATRAGQTVAQLVSWRASLSASIAHPSIVKRGDTIAVLLASIFRSECKTLGIRFDHNGVIQDLDFPIMAPEMRNTIQDKEILMRKNLRTPICNIAAEISGSRMSKAFAILNMLSDDLANKVALADVAYNLYKNIKLAPEDETILVLCSNYLTLKLNEVWREIELQSPGLLSQDQEVLEEFLHIGRGWAREIKRQQDDVIERDRKRDQEEEYSLYTFLARVRLNIALDALREVRCMARTADRVRFTHALIHDAVRAHHRRSNLSKKLGIPVLRTYGPALDDYNITGQNVKVCSIRPKNKPKPTHVPISSE